MKFRTILFIGFLSLISSFPLITRAQVSAPAIPEAVTEEEVRRFMEDYKERYVRMDLDAFMALFSRGAVENRALPYADIREAYRKLIEHSRSLVYELKIYPIQVYSRSAYVRGKYHITQFPKGRGGERVYQGEIQWVIIRENGSLKIREVNFGSER